MNNILVVHTSWYKEHIKSMIDISQGILSTDFNIDLLCAPGVIELPALAKHKILKREGSDQEQYLGVLFLGIVVRGETTHYELISESTAQGLMQLSINTNKPIGFGLIATENLLQAEERVDPSKLNKGREIAQSLVEMLT